MRANMQAAASDRRPIVFVTTSTSGSGSLWRLISAFAGPDRVLVKSTAGLVPGGRADLESWQPVGDYHIFFFNHTSRWNPNFNYKNCRIILNFRDPRDLACNKFFWALQHPSETLDEIALERHRSRVRKMGLSKFVMDIDLRKQYKPFVEIHSRANEFKEDSILILSYAQLCLDVDSVGARIAEFLGVNDVAAIEAAVAPERPTALPDNPKWIGQQWEGGDVSPGRHRHELAPDTIAALTDKYADILRVLRDLDEPRFSELYL